MNDFSQETCTHLAQGLRNLLDGMTLNDLIIIYLACGAPLAVYYFFRNRNRSTAGVWLGLGIRFFFWVPFAVGLLAKKYLPGPASADQFVGDVISDPEREAEVSAVKKVLEQTLRGSSLPLSIYEFRAVVERYIGLTQELRTLTAARRQDPEELEFYRITNHQNKKLGAVCFYRRNRQRLLFHQNLARQDFFEILQQLLEDSKSSLKIRREAGKLFVLLEDAEAQGILANLPKKSLQTPEALNVQNLEKDLWRPEAPKLSPASSISANSPVTTATANLRRKD